MVSDYRTSHFLKGVSVDTKIRGYPQVCFRYREQTGKAIKIDDSFTVLDFQDHALDFFRENHEEATTRLFDLAL